MTRGLRREGWREEIEFAFNRRELREASGLKRLAGRLSIPLWERSRWTRLAVEEKKEGEMEEKLPPWILNTFKSVHPCSNLSGSSVTLVEVMESCSMDELVTRVAGSLNGLRCFDL